MGETSQLGGDIRSVRYGLETGGAEVVTQSTASFRWLGVECTRGGAGFKGACLHFGSERTIPDG